MQPNLNAARPERGTTAASPRLFQLERIVNDLQRLGALFLVDDATDLDLAGGDILDVDLRVRQRLEHALRDAGVNAHAHADHAHLRKIAVVDRRGFRAKLLAE